MTGKNLALYVFVLLSFLCFGMSAMITGAALPEIINDFKWNYTQSGFILASSSLSVFIMAIFAGRLLGKYNPKYLIGAALALLAVSLFFFGSNGNFFLNLVLKTSFGLSFGILEVSGNYIVSRMEKENESYMMGFLHAAYSVGAITGPFILSTFLRNKIPWTSVFRLTSLILVFLIIYLVFLEISFTVQKDPGDSGKEHDGKCFDMFTFLSVLMLMFYVGYEVGLSDWGAEFSVKTYGLTPSKGAMVVSAYWGGLFSGRIFNPFIFRRMSLHMQLLVFSVIAVAGIGLLLFAANSSLVIFLYALAGYGSGSIYPHAMTVIGRIGGKNSSRMLGIASAGGAFGSTVFPMLMSQIANVRGIFTGFLFYFAIGVLQVIIAFVYYFHVRARLRNVMHN